jgi:hypothetical protein
MDENFLLHRPRALDLLQRIRKYNKSWELYVFSSANAIRKYTMEELVDLGISWVWMGLESPRSGYAKLNGTDTLELTRQLHAHGIRVLGSTIVGMEHHTPDNIRDEIEHAVSHATDFHQFMLYTPVPGTPLYAQMRDEGRLIDVDLADIHGQDRFNFVHKAIEREDSKRFLDFAFLRDFERNGPSLYRICKTGLEGWRRYKNHPDLRVRERFTREARALSTAYSALLWAMEKRLRPINETVGAEINKLRHEIRAECGSLQSALSSWFVGPFLLYTTYMEERRLAKGKTYEPETFLERTNWVEV